MTPEPRISNHLTEDGSAIVPPRIAHWLETKAEVTEEWRGRLRDTDWEAHEVMLALHVAAFRYSRSDTGTNSVVGQRQRASSEVWLSTIEAARELGITDRCVRKWIHTGRLPATMSGARWLINQNDLRVHDLTA